MKPKQIFLTVFLVLFVSATAVAQRGPGGMDNPLRQELRQRLNLSDDQQNQIGKLRTEFQKQQVAQRSKLQTAQIELRELMRGDTPDKSAIEKKINELSQFQAQQRIARVHHLFAMRKILTPEQQKIAREAIRERMQHRFMEQRMHRRDSRGPMMRGRGFGKGFRGGMGGFDEEDFDEFDEDPEE